MKFNKGFTLLELLTVMGIIAMLTAMIIAGVGYAHKKSAMSRGSAEIHAFSAALESVKADLGEYPKSADTDAAMPVLPDDLTKAWPSDKPTNDAYKASCAYLTAYLVGAREALI